MYTGPQHETETCGQDDATTHAHPDTSTALHVDTSALQTAIKQSHPKAPMINGILTAAHPAYRSPNTAPYPHPYASARPHLGASTSPYVRPNIHQARPKVYS